MNNSIYYNRISDIVRRDELISSALFRARELNLPNWWLVGGCIRDVVWSNLMFGDCDYSIINDIDIVYFDPSQESKYIDDKLEYDLGGLHGVRWSVKNQYRMHVHNKDIRYINIVDAVYKFPETISTICFSLTPSGDIISFNCYGFEDLFNMRFRPTPYFLKNSTRESFHTRVKAKGWTAKWPNATISH